MSALVITRGLPASGKTTWARAWVAEAEDRRVRVNRDDLRVNLYGRPRLPYEGEEAVSTAQRAAVEALLRKGRDVVVDDTHLRAKHARAWVDLAVATGAEFAVRDFLDVPADECVRRDAERIAQGERGVGERVIRDMHLKFLNGGPLPPVTATTGGTELAACRYIPPPGKPSAVMVDIDGTVALHVDRSPYDPTRYHTDVPNEPVVRLVRDLAAAGECVVYCSGRDETYREATQAWLDLHVDIPGPLFMRAAGDRRNDAVIKPELFWRHIAAEYRVRLVLDDRDRVVKAWRAIGLPVLQVAEGAF